MGGQKGQQPPSTVPSPPQPQDGMGQQPRKVAQGNVLPRVTVWQGTLEFKDPKDYSPYFYIDPLISCKITTYLINGEPQVKTDGFPSNLAVQLIPRSVLRAVGVTYFQNVDPVTFLPEPCPALNALTSSISSDLAGCIRLTNCSVRMIILLCSKEKQVRRSLFLLIVSSQFIVVFTFSTAVNWSKFL